MRQTRPPTGCTPGQCVPHDSPIVDPPVNAPPIDSLRKWIDDPYADPGPWAAYTLGFESRMVRTWYKLSVAFQGAKNLKTGVPTAIAKLRRAVAVLTASASQEVIRQFDAALSQARQAVRTGHGDPTQPELTGVLGLEALEELPPLADAIVPGDHRHDGWYALGAVMAESAELPAIPSALQPAVSFGRIIEVTRRIPSRDRARVESVADLSWLADEYPSADEAILKRQFLELFRGDLTDKEMIWRITPARWGLELFVYHERIQHQLQSLRRIPHWEPDSGELFFDGRVIRIIAKRADAVRAILGEFAAASWARTITHPRAATEKSRILSLRDNHIHSLNESIVSNTIRFGGGGRDDLIKWELVEQS